MPSKKEETTIDILDLLAKGAFLALRNPLETAALAILLRNPKTRGATLRLGWLGVKETARYTGRMTIGTGKIMADALGVAQKARAAKAVIAPRVAPLGGAALTLGTIVLVLKYPEYFGVKSGFYRANEALSTPEMKAYELSAYKSRGVGGGGVII